MTITVINHTNWLGNGSTLTIKLNDKKIVKINPEQQLRINLPQEPATLSVSQLGSKSNPLEVQDGEIIEITSRKLTSKIFFSSLFIFNILVFLTNMFFPTISSKMITISILGVIYIYLLFQVKWYQLTKV